MYLLDSNILIDISRGELKSGYDLMRASDASLFKVPAVVKAELLLGAAKSTRPGEMRFRVESLLLPFEIVPFDDRCASHYANIRATLEKKGMTIGANDYLIAATALAHSAVLVTNNVAEFKRVPGLSIESWQEIDFQPARR